MVRPTPYMDMRTVTLAQVPGVTPAGNTPWTEGPALNVPLLLPPLPPPDLSIAGAPGVVAVTGVDGAAPPAIGGALAPSCGLGVPTATAPCTTCEHAVTTSKNTVAESSFWSNDRKNSL